MSCIEILKHIRVSFASSSLRSLVKTSSLKSQYNASVHPNIMNNCINLTGVVSCHDSVFLRINGLYFFILFLLLYSPSLCPSPFVLVSLPNKSWPSTAVCSLQCNCLPCPHVLHLCLSNQPQPPCVFNPCVSSVLSLFLSLCGFCRCSFLFWL